MSDIRKWLERMEQETLAMDCSEVEVHTLKLREIINEIDRLRTELAERDEQEPVAGPWIKWKDDYGQPVADDVEVDIREKGGCLDHGKAGDLVWDRGGLESVDAFRVYTTPPPAPAAVSESAVKTETLKALGHIAVVSDRCTARHAEPKEKPPGPADPPMFCTRKAGHSGPHTNFRGYTLDSARVEYADPITVCKKCGVRWPCPDARQTMLTATPAARLRSEGSE